MTIEVLMVDVDGVILRGAAGQRWDRDLQADLGVDPAALQKHFFAPHWADVLIGRAHLMDRLPDVLARIAPGVPAERLIEYWFAQDAGLDHAVLNDLAALRGQGVPLHLATDQEHRRAAYLWTELGLSARFDAMHYAADLGARKIQPEFYAAILGRTRLAPGAIGFIDDSPANIETARAAGWRGYVWTPGSSLADALAKMQA
jgi:putative hydrolase of the HAD superfamily